MRRWLMEKSSGTILDQEGCCKCVSTQDGQVQEAVAIVILEVKVAIMADKSVSDALVATNESKVEGNVTLVVTFI